MSETLILDEDRTLPLDELSRASGLPQPLVEELVEWGAFEPVPGARVEFHSRTLVLARRAARLRETFMLDAGGLAIALAYLERIEQLERRVLQLECGRPR